MAIFHSRGLSQALEPDPDDEPETLGEAIRATPPAPCDACPLRGQCATLELACEAFAQYVKRGTTDGERVPRAKIFARVYARRSLR